MALCFCFLLIFHFSTLIHYPEPWADEPWNGARAVSLLENGHPFSVLDEGYRVDVPRPWAVFPLLPIAVYAIPTFLVGSVDLLALRMVSFCSGLFLLLGMMRLGGYFYGRRGQMAALVITGLSQPFLFSAHVARPDIIASALVVWSLSMLATRKSRFPAALPGFLAGLALSFHLRALVAPMIIALFLLIFRGWKIFRWRELYILILAYVAGCFVYVAAQILPDPQSFFATWTMHAGSNRTPPLIDGQGSIVWRSLRLLWDERMQMRQSTVFLPFAGIFYGLIWGTMRTRKLVLFATLAFLSCLFIVRDPMLFNFIMISPTLDLLALPLVVQLFQWGRKTQRDRVIQRYALGGIAGALVLWGAYQNCYLPLRFYWNAYLVAELAQEFVSAKLLPGETVIGPQVFWLGEQKRKFITWEGLKATANTRNTDLEGAFRFLRPDVFIIDNHIRYFFQAGKRDTAWYNDLHLPKEQLDKVLRKHAELVGSQSLRYFGNIEVYRFHWDREVAVVP